LPHRRFHTVTWREGSNAALSSRFAAVRVRCALDSVKQHGRSYCLTRKCYSRVIVVWWSFGLQQRFSRRDAQH
jgi:SRSO17 transposase